MAAAHDLADFVDAFLNFLRRARAGCNAQGIILRTEVFLVGAPRHNDPVVERSSKRSALFFSDANNLAGKIVPANLFADRVYSRKKVFDNIHTDGANGGSGSEIGV